MAERQRRWARRASAHLRKLLGSKCAVCGKRHELEFDCIKPQGHRHHRIEWSWRISFYRQQMAAGNLQLLCGRHNRLKGDNPF